MSGDHGLVQRELDRREAMANRLPPSTARPWCGPHRCEACCRPVHPVDSLWLRCDQALRCEITACYVQNQPANNHGREESNVTRTTRYTISAAHRIAGRSRTTIQRHLKKGKLSAIDGEDGVKLIEASELVRAYGEECDFSVEEQPAKDEQGSSDLVQHELHTLQQRVESLEEERRRERQQLEAQIDHLQDALRLAQEGHNKATLLLESRSGAGEWRTAIELLEAKLAAHEKRREEDAVAANDYRNRPWWRYFAN